MKFGEFIASPARQLSMSAFRALVERLHRTMMERSAPIP
jgi:hypothetical protein